MSNEILVTAALIFVHYFNSTKDTEAKLVNVETELHDSVLKGP